MGAICYNYLKILGDETQINALIDTIYKADPKFLENFPFLIHLDNNPKVWYGLYTLLEELPENGGDIELTYTTKNSPPKEDQLMTLIQTTGLKLINRFESLDYCGIQTITATTASVQIFETIDEYLKIYYQKEVMIPNDLSYRDFRDQYVLNIDSNNWYTDNAGIHYDALIETQILDRIASNDLLLLIHHKWYTPELQTRFLTLLKGAV